MCTKSMFSKAFTTLLPLSEVTKETFELKPSYSKMERNVLRISSEVWGYGTSFVRTSTVSIDVPDELSQCKVTPQYGSLAPEVPKSVVAWTVSTVDNTSVLS
ncbi:uncharacterized protein PHALS_04984 [Plasmopara halstedii]|uniref:Uncharacterized protein n=1 Tax=Plasmopara halstedii TaxID=4781 RepID=A0A0P1AAM6_PLAHL|nr:uncharacterized protein PHALS_04984 [Plasmopara halstedii]CEG37390.1 hypothetical protein PHALS_04984 [Plasmopara halstedii]|eukprot:XP_024573759.1 hypothetical protein PHALS_04984 [Plasmopara halstedii]